MDGAFFSKFLQGEGRIFVRFPPKKQQAASGGLRELGVQRGGQIVFSLFVAGLAQQGEHVGFIASTPG